MIKVLIVDDELKIREVLRSKLERFHPELSIVGMAKNVESAYQACLEHKPDIVFLDITMPGKSGFDFLDLFEKVDFEIIFATGHHEYALDALKVSAIDYILKPFRNDDIRTAVDKAKVRIEQKEAHNRYELLKSNIKSIGNQESTISIPNKDTQELIKIKEIVRFEGWQKYTKIFTINGYSIISSYNLGHFTKTLSNYQFYLVHKSHLVNIEFIKTYSKEGVITLVDGSQVPVSRRRRQEFINDILVLGNNISQPE